MKRNVILALCVFFSFWAQAQKTTGYFNFTYNENDGSIMLDVNENHGEFLYVNYLSSGLGSNDIGLDRGQIGNSRVVEFKKYGNTLYLLEKNLDYRAVSDNKNEALSIEEAFASSILYAFPIVKSANKVHTINLNSMLLSDSHKVSQTLKKSKEGSYKLDKKRSAILPEFCKSFPKNTEFRSMITFGGNPTGRHVSTVVPSPDAITLRTHHSFVELPDNAYKPRKFHPASGYFVKTYKDYAVPIESDMTQRFITRHRLEKSADGSTKEPIVYYIDRGCPEPIKSALMEGASWWNQAFEAAGFKDGFQVKELPEGADPLDVRYNMIQWVHRSTRGWSYGASVVDPRTGEILKGHVSLGSLRVRQDYLIMQALMSPYDGNEDFSETNPMTEVALARLRQLSAHEVGHTIGLSHNFAASTDNKSSVMDYPHPQLKWNGKGIDFSEVYDDKIGDWDKQAIKYGYGIYDDEEKALQAVIKENEAMGLAYITDSDARPTSGANSEAHLWDNGKDIVAELDEIYKIRAYGLSNFGENTIEEGVPYSELEKYIVPLYMMHRYQLEGVAKLVGGIHYSYDVKDGDAIRKVEKVSKKDQERALNAILKTFSHEFLDQEKFVHLILPNAQGYWKTRESAKSNLGPAYDPNALVAASSKHSFSLLMNPHRLNRLADPHYSFGDTHLSNYLAAILKAVESNKEEGLLLREMLLDYMISSFQSSTIYPEAKSDLYQAINMLEKSAGTPAYMKDKIASFKKGDYKGKYLFDSVKIPPGSPIGCH